MKKGLPVVLFLAVVTFFLSAFVAAMVEKHGLLLVIVVALIIVAAIVALLVLVKKKRVLSPMLKLCPHPQAAWSTMMWDSIDPPMHAAPCLTKAKS